MNGVLWALRTGAPWADMPRRYPPYQTCHRRFQTWVEDGALHRALRGLAKDLKDRGNLTSARRTLMAPMRGQKRGLDVRITRRGKATKIMAVADRNALPVSAWIASGERAECHLVVDTLDVRFTKDVPEKLIGDRAYDSGALEVQLGDQYGIELIAP